MKTCKVLMPIGALGAGIKGAEVEYGLTLNPDVIAIDAGSTDSGPAYLGSGLSKYAKMMIKHDLKISILAARKKNIPLFIGSCGTCGSDRGVDDYAAISEEILKEAGLKAKIAKVYSQQNPEVLKAKWKAGKIHALEGAPEITEKTFDECNNIVALMGAEPFIEAYKNGADIVLCGRTTDTAIISALPLFKGCHEGASWHGAKTVECGAQCAADRAGKGAWLEVNEEGFYVKPLDLNAHCTPYSVSAHLLYENVDPFRLTEPSGNIVTYDSKYTQVDPNTVYVTGTKFEKAKQYTMKLEGASTAGYQNICLVGIADRDVMDHPQGWIDGLTEYATQLLGETDISKDDYSFNFKAYGYNAVLDGPVPKDVPPPREIGMLLTVTAKTQELATQVAKSFNPWLLHYPAHPDKQMPSFAFPFSPVDSPRGPVYEFRLHHIVDVDDPLELVRFKYVNV
jgi:hypothetical protein